jgi:hypothetical protein
MVCVRDTGGSGAEMINFDTYSLEHDITLQNESETSFHENRIIGSSDAEPNSSVSIKSRPSNVEVGLPGPSLTFRKRLNLCNYCH